MSNIINFIAAKRRRENLAKMARMDEIEAEMNEILKEYVYVFRPDNKDKK